MTNGALLYKAIYGWELKHDVSERKRLEWETAAARYEALKAERDADAIRAHSQEAIDEMDPEIADARNNHGQNADAIALAVRVMGEELDRMKYDKKHRCHRDYAEVSVDELDERMGFLADALAALKGGGR